MQFLGISGLNPIEQYYYLSVGPSQALKGSIMFADRYGRIPDEQVLLNPIGNAIGLIVQVTNLPLTVAYNIFRVLSSCFLIICFYYLSRQFISSPKTIFLSILFYSFSAGFDWLFQLFHLPFFDAVDDSIPEANMFIAMSGEYYLPLANALFILTLTFAYRVFHNKEQSLVLCGGSLFLLGAVYIYGLVPAVVIIALAALYKGYMDKTLSQNIFTLLKLALFCLPIVGYYLWLILKFPSIDESGWLVAPSFISFCFTFGFGLVFSIAGFFIKNKRQLTSEYYLILWIVVSTIFINTPQTILPIQIQMFIGLGAPLAIISATTLQTLAKAIAGRLYFLQIDRRSLFAGMFVFLFFSLSCITNILFYKKQVDDLDKHTLPWYINTKVYDAIDWSSSNISYNSLVIVPRNLGFFYSAFTGCKVYCGLAYGEKTPEQIINERAIAFIRKNELESGKELLRATGADYLFFDKNLGQNDFEQIRKTLKENFKECFINEEVSVFKLKPQGI